MLLTPHRRLRLWTSLLLAIAVVPGIFRSTPSAHAQGGDNDPKPKPGTVTNALASSPFAAPIESDTTFVVDEASGLDTGCSYRGNGPLEFSVQVDRFPGNTDQLKAAKLIAPEAILRMPAYDVDYSYSGTDFNPERDKIYFNEKLVPTQYLTGENNVWKLNALRIPIDWVNFPSDPGDRKTVTAASNTIRIDIDTANTGEVWCTAIDWAALSIQIAKPVLTVHGIRSGSGAWDKVWKPSLTSRGLPYASINMGALDGIQDNAKKIAEEIEIRKRQWGVDQINIVAHSKGGLDSRHYIENNNSIDRLVQLGTPNGGSPLADAVQAGAINALGVIPTVILDSLAGEASYQLTTPYMSTYNLFHGANPNTGYFSVAGDYRFGGLAGTVGDLFLRGFYGGPSDLVVPVWSVHALRYAIHDTFSTDGSTKDAIHTILNDSEKLHERTLPLLSRLSSSSPSRSSTVEASQSVSNVMTAATTAGAISQGQTKTHTFTIDQAATGNFLLYYGGGDLSLTLVSPTGVRITPSQQPTNPNIAFESVTGSSGPQLKYYSINQPDVGQWTLEVAAPRVSHPSGTEPYLLIGSVAESPIRLEATTDKAAYHANEPVIVKASLRDAGVPIAGATVAAKIVLPDQSTAVITLFDNGQADDQLAGDGDYTGRLASTAQPGSHRILVTASGSTCTKFTREKVLIAPVSKSSSQFSGAYSDSGNDSDGDGLYNELIINVGLDVTAAATYRLFGVLVDDDGEIIATSANSTQLSSGPQTVALRFDGTQIYRHGADGLYTLNVLRLAEDDGLSLLPLDERSNPYSTGEYDHRQFQRPSIFLSGRGTDQAIDTNKNGKFDTITIGVELDVRNAGTYNWSGRLVDRKGTELGFFADTGTLTGGLNNVTFEFDGQKIGPNGVDGPFYLTDLLIFSGSDSAVIFDGYTTQPHQARTFEGFAPKVTINPVTTSCASGLTATLSFEVIDAAVRFDSISANLEGVTGEEITLTPDISGQILQPGPHQVTARFTRVNNDSGTANLRAVFTTVFEGTSRTSASGNVSVCAHKIQLPFVLR